MAEAARRQLSESDVRVSQAAGDAAHYKGEWDEALKERSDFQRRLDAEASARRSKEEVCGLLCVCEVLFPPY